MFLPKLSHQVEDLFILRVMFILSFNHTNDTQRAQILFNNYRVFFNLFEENSRKKDNNSIKFPYLNETKKTTEYQ